MFQRTIGGWWGYRSNSRFVESWQRVRERVPLRLPTTSLLLRSGILSHGFLIGSNEACRALREYDLRRDSFERVENEGASRTEDDRAERSRGADEETMTRWKTDLMKNSAQPWQAGADQRITESIYS